MKTFLARALGAVLVLLVCGAGVAAILVLPHYFGDKAPKELITAGGVVVAGVASFFVKDVLPLILALFKLQPPPPSPPPSPILSPLPTTRKRWCRWFPDSKKITDETRRTIEDQLQLIAAEAEGFFTPRERIVTRANILLPTDKDATTIGHLAFFVWTTPARFAYTKQETDNRFPPGVGICGTAFLTGNVQAEANRKAGIPEEKARNMPGELLAVIGFPLRPANGRIEDIYGVACIDLLSERTDHETALNVVRGALSTIMGSDSIQGHVGTIADALHSVPMLVLDVTTRAVS